MKLLQLVGEKIPGRHSLSLVDGDLKLVLMLGSYIQIVNIETMDLDRTPEELVGDILKSVGEERAP